MNNTLQNDDRYKFLVARFDMEALLLTSTTGYTSIAEAFFLKVTAEGVIHDIVRCQPSDTVSLPVSVGCQTEVVFAGEEPVMLNRCDRFGNAQIVLSKDSAVCVTYVSK